MAFFEFNQTQSTAIAAIDTAMGRSNNEVAIRYTSNPTNEYIFNANDETVTEIENVAEAVMKDDMNISIGKFINQMISEQKLTPVVAN